MKRWTFIALILVTTACAKHTTDQSQFTLNTEGYHDIPLRLNTPVYRITQFVSDTEMTFLYYYPSTSPWYGTYNVDHATIEQQNGSDYTLIFYNSDCHANGSYMTFTITSVNTNELVFTTNEIYPASVTASSTSIPIPQMPALDLPSFTHSSTCRL